MPEGLPKPINGRTFLTSQESFVRRSGTHRVCDSDHEACESSRFHPAFQHSCGFHGLSVPLPSALALLCFRPKNDKNGGRRGERARVNRPEARVHAVLVGMAVPSSRISPNDLRYSPPATWRPTWPA